MTATFHTDELYFWVNGFGQGFVRRGVVGSLVSPFLHPVTPGAVHAAAALWWLAGLACTFLGGALLVWRGMAGGSPAVTLTAGALVAVSPMLGQIAYHVGYPDTLIVALCVLSAVLLWRAPAYAWATALAGLGAVHELTFLLLLPLAVFAACMRPFTRAQAGILAAGVAVAVLLPLLSGEPFGETARRLEAAGLSPADAISQLRTALHQTITGSAGTMAGVWRAHPINGVLGVAYAGLPGGMVMLLGLPAAREWIVSRHGTRAGRAWLLACYAAACMGPVALLALAWDLSRIASFSTLTASLTVSLVAAHRSLHASRPLIGAGCAAALLYLCLPVANLYFDYGRAVNTAGLARVCGPCAKAGLSAVDFFNRGLTLQARTAIDTDARYGGSPAAAPR